MSKKETIGVNCDNLEYATIKIDEIIQRLTDYPSYTSDSFMEKSKGSSFEKIGEVFMSLDEAKSTLIQAMVSVNQVLKETGKEFSNFDDFFKSEFNSSIKAGKTK